MSHAAHTVGISCSIEKKEWGLCKGKGHAESRKRHKIFEVSISSDERCMMIQTALSDECIGQIGPAAVGK